MNTKEIYHSILYIYFQKYFFRLPEQERKKFVAKGVMSKIRSIFITLALNRKRSFLVKRQPASIRHELQGRNWVFVFGKNNYEATKFLANSGFVLVTDRQRDFNKSHPIIELPLRIKWRDYLNFFSIMLFLFKKEGRKALVISDAVFSSIGWLEACQDLIDEFMPAAIVFSNDHSILPRALFFAAKSRGVPTVYIQHASVSQYMPPLHFDLSLLEGNDAYDKYKEKGVDGIVKLIGMPRFDPFILRRRKKYMSNINSIGIAFNTVDSTKKIALLVVALRSHFPGLKIKLRFHPKDKRDFTKAFAAIAGLFEFSDSRVISPFEFILGCDLTIAGDTSIHLEAKMLNVESLYFDLSDVGAHIKDLYGYIENGLIREAGTIDEVIDFIQSNSRQYGESKASYYNAAIDSDFEGKSAVIATEQILQFLNQQE
jgi:hypothetical protein